MGNTETNEEINLNKERPNRRHSCITIDAAFPIRATNAVYTSKILLRGMLKFKIVEM